MHPFGWGGVIQACVGIDCDERIRDFVTIALYKFTFIIPLPYHGYVLSELRLIDTLYSKKIVNYI